MRDWMQLTRTHTVPLESVPAGIGAALATGTIYDPMVLLWFIFGALYHITGYGHNSVRDYLSGHDKDDPNKQHHPMNRRGESFVDNADFAMKVLLVSVLGYMLLLLIISPNGTSIGMLALAFITVMCALAYNYYSKETSSKFLPISVAHTMVFIIPYLAMGGDLTWWFVLVTGYIFIWVVYQIAISGELKDIETDDSNLLKDLGAMIYYYPQTDKKALEPGKARDVSRLVKNIQFAVGAGAIISMGGNIFAIIAVAVISLFYEGKMMKEGEYIRESKMRQMSIIEALSLAGLCVIAMPVIGQLESLVVLVASAIWVLVFNKIEWGTVLAPDV